MEPLPEITRRQQALVDTCFEESLYEAGIGILDKIRTSSAVPSRQHIYQLLYLSLYPPNAPIAVAKPALPKPVKRRGTAKSRGEIPIVTPPSQEAIDQALSVLHHFLATNGPNAMLGAIPSYENDMMREEGHDGMNALQYHATIITRAKHCWELLSQDYILSNVELPPGRGKGKVGVNAWGVLGWFVEAFEKEAIADGGASSSLANQLPKSSSGVKTAMDAPLDVVIAAFAQPLDGQKMELGRRLLNLLIGLTKATPPKLSLDRLLFETCRRLEGMTLTSYSAFLAGVTQTDFKLSLACSFISKHSEEPAPPAPSTPAKRPASRTRRGTTPVPSVRPVGAHSYSPERALAALRLPVKLQDDLEEEGEREGEEQVQSADEQRLRFDMMKVHLLGAINDKVMNDPGWRDVVAGWLKAGGGRVESGDMIGEGGGVLMEKMAAVKWAAAGYADGWQWLVSS